jgi:hypothetical protein
VKIKTRASGFFYGEEGGPSVRKDGLHRELFDQLNKLRNRNFLCPALQIKRPAEVFGV